MTTKRETLIEALIALFQATPGFPATVERTLDSTFSSEEGRILVVHRGGEVPTANVSGSALRDCEIFLSTVTRGTSPEADSDAVLEVAHPLLMTFKHAGLMQVKEVRTDAPQYGGESGKVCLITVRYLLRYSTAANTLSS